MSSGPPDAASMPREEDGNNARRRITYSREFLLSVGASESCRNNNKLPVGIDASMLSAMRWHWVIWDRCSMALPLPQRSSRSGAAASPGDDDDDTSSHVEMWVPLSRHRHRQHQGDGDDDDLRERAREPEASQASQTSAGGSKSKTCTRFFSSTDGCCFGDDCRYLHYLPGDHHDHDQAVAEMKNLNLYGPALIHSPGRATMGSAGPDRAPRPAATTPATVKSRRCRNCDTAEGCRWGDRCYFAHGEAELGKQMTPGSRFKTRLCESFVISGSCAFGGRCHFAHGENELRKPVAY